MPTSYSTYLYITTLTRLNHQGPPIPSLSPPHLIPNHHSLPQIRKVDPPLSLSVIFPILGNLLPNPTQTRHINPHQPNNVQRRPNQPLLPALHALVLLRAELRPVPGAPGRDPRVPQPAAEQPGEPGHGVRAVREQDQRTAAAAAAAAAAVG